MKFLKGGRTIILVYKIFGALAQYILTLALAKLFPPVDVGRFILGRTLMRMSGTVSSLGMNSGIIKYIQCFESEGSEGNIREAIVVGVTIAGLVSLLVASALFLLSGWIATIAFEDPGISGMLKAFAVGIPFFTILSVELGVLRGLKKAELYAFSENVLYNLLILVLFVLLCYSFREIEYGAYSIVASCMLLVGFCSVVIAKCVNNLNDVKSSWSKKELVQYSLPVMGSGLISMLLRWSDTLILGMLSSMDDVGVYAVVSRVVFASDVFLYSAGVQFAPLVAREYAEKSNEIGQIYRKTAKWVRCYGVSFAILLILLGQWVLGFFGKEYVEGYMALVVLSIGQIVSLWVGPASYVLTMTGAQKVDFIIRILALISNIILNILLIPKYGLVGCAIATSVSLICCNIMVVIANYKYRQISVF